MRSRLSFDEALTLWRAREVARVHAGLRGFVVLFVLLECFGYCVLGYGWLGLLVLGLPWALFSCRRWVLRWARRGLWWGVNHTTDAVVTWLHEHRRTH